MGLTSVGPARQIGEKDKGKADRGENNVGDQQKEIHRTDPAGPGEFGFRGGEMIGDVAEQEQAGQNQRSIDEKAVGDDVPFFHGNHRKDKADGDEAIQR